MPHQFVHASRLMVANLHCTASSGCIKRKVCQSGGLSLADPRINTVTNECRKRAIRDPSSKFHHLDVTKILSPMAPKMVPRSLLRRLLVYFPQRESRICAQCYIQSCAHASNKCPQLKSSCYHSSAEREHCTTGQLIARLDSTVL